MSIARLIEVFRVELRRNLTRPVFWILIALLALVAWGLSTGHMTIQSGDATVGGKKAFITSEFAYARVVTIFDFLMLSMFLAVLAGLPVVTDEEHKVHEVLHATPLRATEYIFGKFLAVFAVFLIVSLAHAGFSAVFNHLIPNAEAVDIRGPFHAINYLRPTFLLGGPGMLFIAAACFTIGTLTRRPILVFLFPIALLLVCGMFLWDWSPSWLDPDINRLLMWIDPSGLRWLTETWLKVDRGVEFYNHQRVPIDPGFGISRLVLAALAIGLVAWTRWRFERGLRGAVAEPRRRELLDQAARGEPLPAVPAATSTRPLGELHMTQRPVGRWRGALVMAGSEARGLLRHPGLYLFVPIIVLEVIGNAMFDVGPFDVELLFSSGKLAVRSLGALILCGVPLLMFFTVESLHRERASGLAALQLATPLPTSSYLIGKLLGVSVVALVLIAATLAACLIALLWQGRVPIELGPFVLVFGLLGIPTFVAWSAFITAVFAITGSRMTSYAIGLGSLIGTFYAIGFGGGMSWRWNWPLWGVIPWSDISRLEMNGHALTLNRALILGFAVFCLALAVRVFPRREFDAVRVLHRFRPLALLRSLLALLPYAAVPLVLSGLLAAEINRGFQGAAAEKRAKDYWRRNVRTFTDAVPPHVAGAEVAVDLYPTERRLVSAGHLIVRNGTDKPMAQFPVTQGGHWQNVSWTLDDAPLTPEDRAGLQVITPPTPLLPGATVKLGFRFDGHFPDGITKNGGGADQFVLPSGAVLTTFTPSFVPLLGYQESVGVDKENHYDAKEYADDFYVGVTRSAFGGGPPYAVRTTISGPADWTLNGIGVITSDVVDAGRRTVVWEADHPVTFFNVVAGPLLRRDGDGTALFHNAQHTVNLDEMMEALDGARRFFSEWFHPYPWQLLKITEFPGIASYAQGFASNISFSESIGFMTKSDPKVNLAFMVTAHEIAHQWWGNMLQPGEGPGGNILSEGMAHFSTMLLFEQVKGEHQRMEFMKRIEDRYGDNRQADSERPLVKIDGSRPGDTTVTYDKGGFVFWMLLQHLGREAGMRGYREFIERYKDAEDHPVLQDFVAVMREFAGDPAAFDAFAQQWFFSVVVPEYRVHETRVERPALVAGGQEAATWEVHATIENVGSATMPVVIAATAGMRFDDGKVAPGYRESRVTQVIGPNQSVAVSLSCDFSPERIIVDPDVMVLQLVRERAVADL